MAYRYRVSLPNFTVVTNPVIAPLIGALLAALVASALLHSRQAVAAMPPVQLDSNGEDLSLSALTARRNDADWLAIDDEHSGFAIHLPGKWREAPGSFEHERDVIASPGWHFSRLYDCPQQFCGMGMRIVVSGGVLPASINITSVNDLKDQMPRREVARVGAMIAGVPYIDPASLKPISRSKTSGYRMHTTRLQTGQPPIALVIDCLYHRNSFLILTVVTDETDVAAGETALNDIAARVKIAPGSLSRR